MGLDSAPHVAASGISIVYYFAPDAEQDWVWLTRGSIFATVLWLGASLGFKFYIANMGSYTETYGAIGVVRRTIGPAAMRAWLEKRRKEGDKAA